jgi:hypothetical protein
MRASRRGDRRRSLRTTCERLADVTARDRFGHDAITGARLIRGQGSDVAGRRRRHRLEQEQSRWELQRRRPLLVLAEARGANVRTLTITGKRKPTTRVGRTFPRTDSQRLSRVPTAGRFLTLAPVVDGASGFAATRDLDRQCWSVPSATITHAPVMVTRSPRMPISIRLGRPVRWACSITMVEPSTIRPWVTRWLASGPAAVPVAGSSEMPTVGLKKRA